MHLGAATGIDECLNGALTPLELFGTIEADFAKTTSPRTIATMR